MARGHLTETFVNITWYRTGLLKLFCSATPFKKSFF